MINRQSQIFIMPTRRFRRLVMDDVFWRAVDLGGRALPPGTVGQLLTRGVLSLRLARADLAAPLLSIPETGFVFDGTRKKPKVGASPHEVISKIRSAIQMFSKIPFDLCLCRSSSVVYTISSFIFFDFRPGFVRTS